MCSPLGARAYTTTEAPQAFPMVFEGGNWRIADATYVINVTGPILHSGGGGRLALDADPAVRWRSRCRSSPG